MLGRQLCLLVLHKLCDIGLHADIVRELAHVVVHWRDAEVIDKRIPIPPVVGQCDLRRLSKCGCIPQDSYALLLSPDTLQEI